MNHWSTRVLAAACVAALPLAAAAQQAGAEFKERTLRVSHVQPKDNSLQLAVERLSAIVGPKTGGKMKLRGYPDGQLGGELQAISSVQGGVLDMTMVSTAAVATVAKEFGVYDLPFLFNDSQEADQVLDGPQGRKLLDKLPEKNMVGLCYFENGFRHVTNSRRPITRAEDLKGLKIRTVQNPVYIDVFNTLGANATPMPYPEVFGALESKVIDAQETPYGNIHGSKFYEVQKYMTTTGHIYNAAVLAVSKKVWDQMSAAEHKVLQEGCTAAQEFQRRYNRETDPKLHADLRAKGLAINDVAPAERARMREMLKPVYDKYSRVLGEDLVRQTVAELDKIRAKAK